MHSCNDNDNGRKVGGSSSSDGMAKKEVLSIEIRRMGKE